MSTTRLESADEIMDQIWLNSVDRLFRKPKTKHAVMTTYAEQRVYDTSLEKLQKGIDPREIASSIDCQLRILEVNRRI